MRSVLYGAAILLIAVIAAGLLVFYTVTEKSNALSEAERAVVINEAMSGNKGVLFDDEGKSSDWVELYNSSDEAVDLSRFSLSDDASKPEKWVFPDITLEAHGYVVVYLSGRSKKDADAGSLHASFKLKSKGENLLLCVKGQIVDSVMLPAMPDNVSYCRTEDDWRLADVPTPGLSNGRMG